MEKDRRRGERKAVKIENQHDHQHHHHDHDHDEDEEHSCHGHHSDDDKWMNPEERLMMFNPLPSDKI